MKREVYTSLLSMICWQLGQGLLGLLFQLTLPGSHKPDALLIFVAILLLSTSHDCLHSTYKLIIATSNHNISRKVHIYNLKGNFKILDGLGVHSRYQEAGPNKYTGYKTNCHSRSTTVKKLRMLTS